MLKQLFQNQFVDGLRRSHYLRINACCLVVDLVVVQVLGDEVSEGLEGEEADVGRLRVDLVDEDGQEVVDDVLVLVEEDLVGAGHAFCAEEETLPELLHHVVSVRQVFGARAAQLQHARHELHEVALADF